MENTISQKLIEDAQDCLSTHLLPNRVVKLLFLLSANPPATMIVCNSKEEAEKITKKRIRLLKNKERRK